MKYCEVTIMDERNLNKNSKEDKQIEKLERENITYSTSEENGLDLLEIVEMYLCKSCIKL